MRTLVYCQIARLYMLLLVNCGPRIGIFCHAYVIKIIQDHMMRSFLNKRRRTVNTRRNLRLSKARKDMTRRSQQHANRKWSNMISSNRGTRGDITHILLRLTRSWHQQYGNPLRETHKNMRVKIRTLSYYIIHREVAIHPNKQYNQQQYICRQPAAH